MTISSTYVARFPNTAPFLTALQTNASIVRDLAAAVARVAPEAHLLIISNPVNSTVPIVSEVLKAAGVYDPRRVFGVTTLDVVRARRFLSEVTGAPTAETGVTVVGGHSGSTIVPLLSHNAHGKGVSGAAYDALVHRIQFGGDEVVQAKDGAGSATLSMAYAGAKFASTLLRGLNGEKGVVAPSFVKSDLFADQGVEYFSSNVELGVSATRVTLEPHADILLCSPTASRRSILLARSRHPRRSSSPPACPTSRRTSRRAKPLSLKS